MIAFAPDDEQKLIQDTARQLAAERLWPHIRDTEADRALPRELIIEAHGMGITMPTVDAEAGGPGLGLVTTCLVEEQLAWGDVSACYALGGPGALAPFVHELGSARQQRDVLSRFGGDDAAGRRGAVAFGEPTPPPREGLGTTATRDGNEWVLRGHKSHVVNAGCADRYVVIAQVDADAGWQGLGAFVVPGDAAGLEPGPRHRLLGIDAAHVADIALVDVRVPNEARLDGDDDVAGALVRAFARLALVTSARAVGVAQRAWEQTHEYCGERHAFGKPIGHFQAVAFTVTDRLMDVEGARWMVWRAARAWDRDGAPDLGAIASAGAQAQEAALRCGDDGVQLHGGAGFIRDHPIEKLYRDARQLGLMGPSTAALDQLAAECELRDTVDPAAVLPTPDIQPVCI